MPPADLPPAVTGTRQDLATPAGRVSVYSDGPPEAPPLLLVHSVNAAGSAYDVRPLYEHYRATRRVIAPELPGFGHSERSDRLYTPRLMTDALHAVVASLRAAHGAAPLDALALSLGCEFLARAASETPAAFRSLALVSPTGFSGTKRRQGPPEAHRGMPGVRAVVGARPWGRALYDLLTTRPSVRYFLRKTFGAPQVDPGLLEYCLQTARVPGAQYAPFCFLSGFLFSADIHRVYASLRPPVWMSHGVRGDFVDYQQKRDFEARENWRFSVFETGALPYFEAREEFVRAFDTFLASPPAPSAVE